MSFLNQLALNNLFYYYTYFFNTLSNKILSLNHLYFFVNRMKSTKSCYLKKKSYKIFVNTVLNCCVSIWQCLNTLEDWRNWTVPSQALLLSGEGGLSNEYLSSYSIEHFYVMTLITKQNLPSWSILGGFLFVILPLTSNLI